MKKIILTIFLLAITTNIQAQTNPKEMLLKEIAPYSLDDFIRIHEGVIKKNPHKAQSYFELSMIYGIGKDDWLTAIDYCRKGLLIDPGNPEGHLSLGTAYLETDKINDALEEAELLENIGFPDQADILRMQVVMKIQKTGQQIPIKYLEKTSEAFRRVLEKIAKEGKME